MIITVITVETQNFASLQNKTKTPQMTNKFQNKYRITSPLYHSKGISAESGKVRTKNKPSPKCCGMAQRIEKKKYWKGSCEN